MIAADLLEQAADLLWVRGRCVGRFQNGERLCVLGAFGTVCPMDVKASLFAEDALCLYVGVENVSTWNDSLPITPENDALVVDSLRRCAKALREDA